MPIVSKLVVHNFRNIVSSVLEPSPRVNIFYGENGAGKTSLLESMYYLGLGRSFRTSHANHLIRHDASEFSIFATLLRDNQLLPIGIEKNRTGERQIKINGEMVKTVSPLAKHLPLQLMSTISYRFFFNGPKIRRQFLDWLLFHVEQSFFPEWQRFQRALKQRNASIKASLPIEQVAIWDDEFIRSANEIDRLRRESIIRFEPLFSRVLNKLLPNYSINLSYYSGWNREKSLELALQESFRRDLQLGFTQAGPQRADLKLVINGVSAQEVLSQGQQKLALYAFHLAQGLALKETLGRGPVYLMDDVASELDEKKRACIGHVLSEIDSQVFITGTSNQDFHSILDLNEAKMFHVEHGQLHEK